MCRGRGAPEKTDSDAVAASSTRAGSAPSSSSPVRRGRATVARSLPHPTHVPSGRERLHHVLQRPYVAPMGQVRGFEQRR